MKSANEALYDATIRHQIKLLRYSEGQARDAARILVEADAQLEALLKTELTETAEARLKKLLVDIRKQREAMLEALAQEIEKDSEELALNEATWEMEALRASSPIELKLNAVSPATLKAVTGQPINGVPLSGWLGTMAAGDINRIEQQLRLGITQGETLDQLVRRIRGTKANGYTDGATAITRRNAQTIARTAANHVSNSARQEVWNANADIIQGVRWTATLDGRTSDVCRGRDGQVYPVNEGPRPPGHPGCRSTTVPILDGEEIVGDRPFVRDTRTRAQRETDFRKEAREKAGAKWKDMTKDQRQDAIRAERKKWTAENIGQVPTTETYDSWLRKQPKEFQSEVLGPEKAKMFRDGMTMDKFIDEKGKPYTIKELKAATQQDMLNVVQPGVGMKAKALLQQGMSTPEVLDAIKKEYPDANTSAASIASYKTELKKAGALDQLVGKVPTGGVKQALAVQDVVKNMEGNLPEGLKHAIGGQWANVVEDLDGTPGAYGYYQAGKGVQLSGKKLSAIHPMQAQQVIAHELGHLLHKQHDVLLPADLMGSLNDGKAYLSSEGKKVYGYYLASNDELVAEIYAQALSPSVLTSQGLSAVEFNDVFKFEISEAKKLLQEKFPVPHKNAPPPVLGAPTEVFEVAGQHKTVGSLAKALLQQGLDDESVLAAVKVQFPDAKTSKASLASYKVDLKKAGLLPAKGSGPTVIAKAVPDVAPIPPSPAMQQVVKEQAAVGVQLTVPSLYGKPLNVDQEDALDHIFTKFNAAAKKGNFSGAEGFPELEEMKDVVQQAMGLSTAQVDEIVALAEFQVLEKAALQAAAKVEKVIEKAVKPTKVKGPALLGKELAPYDKSIVDNMEKKFLEEMAKPDWADPAKQQSIVDAIAKKYQYEAKTKVPKWIELAKYNAELKTGKTVAAEMPKAAPALAKPKLYGARLGNLSTQLLTKLKTYFAGGGDIPGAQAMLKSTFGTAYKETGGADLIELAKYELATGKAAAKPYLAQAQVDHAKAVAEQQIKKQEQLAQIRAGIIPSRPAMSPREGFPPPPRFTNQMKLAAVKLYNGGHWGKQMESINERQRQLGLPELTQDEAFAVVVYTGNAYSALNKALRSGKYPNMPELQAFVEAAQLGLAKMPKHRGLTSRGISYVNPKLAQHIEQVYQPGAIVEEQAFVSSSRGEVAAFSGPVFMKIQSKTGVWVDPFSLHPGENEVLYKPGTRFKVNKVEQVGSKKIIYMEELEP